MKKLDQLKQYHAYFVTACLFLITCFVTMNFVFFPFACCFIALGFASKFKEEGRLVKPENSSNKQADPEN